MREIDQEIRFSIWTGLAAHQPFRNINRARVNGCPYHEPTDASA
ncbi:hypothetical protein [Sphingomonas sp. S-NIH.Pt15_0812]|nr:hypothetical protein [Sphingomonas sp. S-NIH.Pt15_0812]